MQSRAHLPFRGWSLLVTRAGRLWMPPAWLGITLPHPFGPGIGLPPNSPTSHSTLGDNMDLDIRYVAGLFDGEGWITICKQNLGGRFHYSADYVRYQLVAGIGMTYRPLIEQLHKQFGGGFYINRTAQKKMPKSRAGFMWKLSSQPAADFLKLIEPHLIAKLDEAVAAIEFQRHIRKHTHDFRYRPEMRPALYADREEFRRQLLAFKKREFDTPVVGDPTLPAN